MDPAFPPLEKKGSHIMICSGEAGWERQVLVPRKMTGTTFSTMSSAAGSRPKKEPNANEVPEPLETSES